MDMDLKYPSFREVEAMIRTDFELNAEFSKNNYLRMEHVFDNYDNEAEVRRMGEAINEWGGFQALQANFYILCKVLKHLLCENPKPEEIDLRPKLVRIKNNVNEYWDGIGDWKK